MTNWKYVSYGSLKELDARIDWNDLQFFLIVYLIIWCWGQKIHEGVGLCDFVKDQQFRDRFCLTIDQFLGKVMLGSNLEKSRFLLEIILKIYYLRWKFSIILLVIELAEVGIEEPGTSVRLKYFNRYHFIEHFRAHKIASIQTQ